eukprot:1160653-Pelagomonas_calceolata.AAC.16
MVEVLGAVPSLSTCRQTHRQRGPQGKSTSLSCMLAPSGAQMRAIVGPGGGASCDTKHGPTEVTKKKDRLRMQRPAMCI